MRFYNKNKYLIWALIDDRTGNKNQILAVLESLKIPFKIIEVKYNWMARLPNFILQTFGGLIHIHALDIKNTKELPNLVLSCGRRTFPISNRLFSMFEKPPILVHLMYPKFSINKSRYKFIFTPHHDKIIDKPNIIRTLGSPALKKVSSKKKNPYKNNPIISLLVGGNHGNYKLESDSVSIIIDQILKKIGKGILLISTSRRTSIEVIKSIDKWNFKHNSIKVVYHPKIEKKNNPIKDMFSFSDELVITGDSISMISEACQYKKPVRIYYNKKICSRKHLNFCEKIIREGYAFSFESLLKKCNKIKVLDTTEIIKKNILGHIT